MEVIRTSLLPRRLTQMYTDTKKSFEQIIQTDTTHPQSSSFNVKLCIQKDRFIAWGLDWEDSNGDQSEDIDSSLDRAGLSDLVASIISTTQTLIDEADRIQPQSRSHLTGVYPMEKSGISLHSDPWTTTKSTRLEDILRDITVSIDTLCDLSRSRQCIPKFSHSKDETSSRNLTTANKASPHVMSSISKSLETKDSSLVQSQPSSNSFRYIDPNDLIYPTRVQQPTATPPSYDSTAIDPGNRIFALLRSSDALEKISPSSGQTFDRPVLVDYYSEADTNPKNGSLPSLQRLEDLVLSLQGLDQAFENIYTGSLKILGWFADPHDSKYAFVYEIPQPYLSKVPFSPGALNPPQSLLSYLQHSGVTDTFNVPCLEDRFRLALNLVSNLLHIHAKGLTHRNINSNNVVFVSESPAQGAESRPWKDGVIRKPFLVSWDQCTEDTPILEPETLISNIYRPPGIERGQRSKYRPVHDIYSLGLILFEIGMWIPLNKLWKTKYARSDFKARLQAIYAKKLAAKCGTAYMNAVEYCLQAADEDYATDTSVRPSSRDQQAKVQNDYYWNVVKPLERCCAVDVSDEPKVVPATSASVAHRGSLNVKPQSPDPSNVQLPKVHNATTEVQDSERPEWGMRKGFSPKCPKGINLSIWDYGVDGEYEDYFKAVMSPKIEWMALKAIPLSESWELSPCMTGSSPASARPTILMVCKKTSLSIGWKILNYANQEKRMFDIYVTPGQLRYSKGKKTKGRKTKKIVKGEDKPGQYPTRYQQKPACGASIGCFVDEQHSEAVTFGGVVLVNGEPHGMSVHHMLEDSDAGSDISEPEESVFSETSDSAVFFDDMPSNMPDPISEFENLPDGFDVLEMLKAEAEGEEDDVGGLRLGTKPGEGEPIIVTQPALDDVDPNYFPSEEEMSDDHLVIHGLGTIHASSGLRRLKYEDVPHEIDWALFKIHDDRKPTLNAVDGGIKHCEKAVQEFFPSQILKADALGNLKVHAFGSTSGLETGKIRPKMELTRMPGRRFLSPVWKFEGRFGVGGDSGAWIIDNKTGGLCGHVSSFSESQQYGVLAPMEAQLHDMEETLGVKVALPNGEKGRSQSFREQILQARVDQPSSLQDGNRRSTLGSDYASDNASDDELLEEVQSMSPPGSPELATSPLSLRQMSEPLNEISLNNVAEKWESAQASKRNSVEKGSTKDGRSRAGTVHVRDGGVKAIC